MKKQLTDVEGVKLGDRATLDSLLKTKKLYDVDGIAEITGFCVRYVRQLCRTGRVSHHKLLGRYYMTPAEVAALLTPVPKKFVIASAE